MVLILAALVFLAFYIPYKLISSIGKSNLPKPQNPTIHIHNHTHITNHITKNRLTVIDDKTKKSVLDLRQQ